MYTNCLQCGLGVVVDPEPLVDWLAIDGDALRQSCVPSLAVSEGRLARHRSVRPRAPAGTCSFCGRLYEAASQGYCSEQCQLEARVRSDPSYVRQLVLERDRGVCAGCGEDTGALSEALACYSGDERATLAGWLIGSGYPPHRVASDSLWDAHHIKPVADGGGYCGLDNYETLCLPCHKKIKMSSG